MSHAIIPAPVRFDVSKGREFGFRSGTRIAYTATKLAPIVERFCSEITRRTGLRVAPMAAYPESNEPSVRTELATGDELAALLAPIGVSPTGDGPADERYSLAINGDQVVVRAVEPVGVAHKAWSDPQIATWTDHRDRLATHSWLWEQDDLKYFRTSTVDWV